MIDDYYTRKPGTFLPSCAKRTIDSRPFVPSREEMECSRQALLEAALPKEKFCDVCEEPDNTKPLSLSLAP